MGFLNKIFGGSKNAVKEDEAAQKEVEEEAAKVIQVDERLIGSINTLLQSLANLQKKVHEEMEARHDGSQRLGHMMINVMKKQLRAILETKSVSKEYAEIRTIMGSFARMSERFKTLPYYDPTFQDDLVAISDQLRQLEHLLEVKESILHDEFRKVKEEQ